MHSTIHLLKYLDLVLIWLVLLLFNFNINGVYLINYLAVAALMYLVFKGTSMNFWILIALSFIMALSFLGFARSGGFSEPFKYVFCFLQIFIFYKYYTKRILTQTRAVKSFYVLFDFFRKTYIIYLMFAFYEFISGRFLWFESRNYDSFLPRVNLGFGDPNSLASFILIGIIFIPKRFSISNLLIVIAGLLTFSRAFIISYLVASIKKLDYRLHRIWRWLPLSLFLGSFFIFYSDFIIKFFGVNLDMDFIVDHLLSSGELDNPRLVEWEFAIHNIGLIPDWSVFHLTYDPHNSLLLALNLFGVTGLIALIFVFGKCYRSISRSIFDRLQKSNFNFMTLCFIIFSMFNSELFSVRSTASLGIVLGLLVGVQGACKQVS